MLHWLHGIFCPGVLYDFLRLVGVSFQDFRLPIHRYIYLSRSKEGKLDIDRLHGR